MAMRASVGGLVASAFLIVLGITFMAAGAMESGTGAMFSMGTFVVGIIGVIASLVAGSSGAGDDLEVRLAELDELKERGILTAAEHKKKREAMIAHWGE